MTFPRHPSKALLAPLAILVGLSVTGCLQAPIRPEVQPTPVESMLERHARSAVAAVQALQAPATVTAPAAPAAPARLELNLAVKPVKPTLDGAQDKAAVVTGKPQPLTLTDELESALAQAAARHGYTPLPPTGRRLTPVIVSVYKAATFEEAVSQMAAAAGAAADIEYDAAARRVRVIYRPIPAPIR